MSVLSSLPREKGYVLVSDVSETNPLESGFEWAVDWDTDFIGKEELQRVKENGPEKNLLGLELSDDEIDESTLEPETPVEKDGQEVGKLTTITYGFTVGKYIGYVLVDRDKAGKGDEVTVNGQKGKLVNRMFFDTSNERLVK